MDLLTLLQSWKSLKAFDWKLNVLLPPDGRPTNVPPRSKETRTPPGTPPPRKDPAPTGRLNQRQNEPKSFQKTNQEPNLSDSK